jgi:hypothetical protein
MTQIGKGTAIPIVHTVELLDWATGGPMPEGWRRRARPHSPPRSGRKTLDQERWSEVDVAIVGAGAAALRRRADAGTPGCGWW